MQLSLLRVLKPWVDCWSVSEGASSLWQGLRIFSTLFERKQIKSIIASEYSFRVQATIIYYQAAQSSWGPRLHWIASRVSSSCSHILAGPGINTTSLSQLGVRSTSFAYLMLQGQPKSGLSFLGRKIQEAGNGSFQAGPRNWHRPLSFESFCTVPGLSQMCKCGLIGGQSALQRNVWERWLCVGHLWERPSATPDPMCSVWELRRSRVTVCLSHSHLPSGLCIQGLGANPG